FLSMLLIFHHFNNRRKILYFLIGALPMVSLYFYFKIMYAPVSDLIEGQDAGIIKKILSVDRYIIILKYLINLITLKYPLFLILSFSVFLLSPKKILSGTVLILISTLIIYLFVYIITPYNINWHLA